MQTDATNANEGCLESRLPKAQPKDSSMIYIYICMYTRLPGAIDGEFIWFVNVFNIKCFWPGDQPHCIHTKISSRSPVLICKSIPDESQNPTLHFQHMPLQRHPAFPIISKPIQGSRRSEVSICPNSKSCWFPTPKSRMVYSILNFPSFERSCGAGVEPIKQKCLLNVFWNNTHGSTFCLSQDLLSEETQQIQKKEEMSHTQLKATQQHRLGAQGGQPAFMELARNTYSGYGQPRAAVNMSARCAAERACGLFRHACGHVRTFSSTALTSYASLCPCTMPLGCIQFASGPLLFPCPTANT